MENVVKKLDVVLESLMEMKKGQLNESQLGEFAKKEVLDTCDLTVLFQNDRRTIQRWRDDQKLKFAKISGRCYYLWVDILPMLATGYKAPKKQKAA